jgi:hypothetical protein
METVEDVLTEYESRLADLEEVSAGLLDAYKELWVDHQALFRCMRNTGLFSKDMFTRIRREIVREMNGESDTILPVLRGLIGDKTSYRSKPRYQDAELDDILKLAVLRHNSHYTLDTLPDDQLTMVCYRAAIDICYEQAARNAPFNILNIQGLQLDRSTVLNNWLQLAQKYQEMYQIEMTGGLGAQGQILYGELTRMSYTTGREVPYRQVTQFEPVVLKIFSTDDLHVELEWTVIRHQDFFAYKIMRASDGVTFSEVGVTYDPQQVRFGEDLDAGVYDYRIDTYRSIAFSPNNNYPWSPQIGNYLITPSNTISVEVA